MKWQALNPQPDEAGNVHARHDNQGNWLARSVKAGEPAVYPELLMMPHAATCTALRKPEGGLPDGVIDLAERRQLRAARGSDGHHR